MTNQNKLRPKDLGLVTKLVRVTDDQTTGQLMRRARLQTGMSLRGLAKKLGYSAPYVSDLELGRQNWNEERIEKFKRILFPDFP